eukprot:TRINITY_DN263_c0_g1_i1.p1 TRINITY_DN263_c0_g1~~TRINITY_DN263_c0_g1_i1.p1  ORF type:complete len:107 (-),score=24.39 TRINITY_DN263_c0_g1_i1:48-368(-)
MHFGWYVYTEELHAEIKKKFHEAFSVLERHFGASGTKFLTGDHLTLADINLALFTNGNLKLNLDAEFRKAFPKTINYLLTLYAEPAIKASIGDVKLLETFVAPKPK